MAKEQTSQSATVRANHLRQLGLHNERLAKKWDRIARKLAKNNK